MKRNTRSADVMSEDFTQFIVGDFADERHGAIKRGQSSRGIRR